jgi:hypothetical protein
MSCSILRPHLTDARPPHWPADASVDLHYRLLGDWHISVWRYDSWRPGFYAWTLFDNRHLAFRAVTSGTVRGQRRALRAAVRSAQRGGR